MTRVFAGFIDGLYRIYESDGSYSVLTEAVVKDGIAEYPITGLELYEGSLRGTTGALERYPSLQYGEVMTDSCVVLREDSRGYLICDAYGEQRLVTEEGLIDFFSGGISCANRKVVVRGGKVFVSKLNTAKGETPSEGSLEAKLESKKIMKNAISIGDLVSDSSRLVSNLDTSPLTLAEWSRDVDVNGYKSADKFSLAFSFIKENFLDIYSVLSCLELRDAKGTGVRTMAVSPGALYVSEDFVAKLSPSAVVFVLMHEVYHILMGHHASSRDKDHRLSNIAYDLYINKLVASQLGMRRKDTGFESDFIYGKTQTAKFALPPAILYEDAVDLQSDSGESLYYSLLAEQEQYLKDLLDILKDKLDKSLSSGGYSSPGLGDAVSRGDSVGGYSLPRGITKTDPSREDTPVENGRKSEPKEDKKEAQGAAESGRPETMQERIRRLTAEKMRKMREEKGGDAVEEPSKCHGEGGIESTSAALADWSLGSDVIEREEDAKGTKEEDLIEQHRNLLEKAKVVYTEMKAEAERIASSSKNAGDGPASGNVVDFEAYKLKPEPMDWRRLLRRYLKEVPKRYYMSQTTPLRSRLGSGEVIPGPKALTDKGITNLIIAVDTSGSISRGEYNYMINQLYDLVTRMKYKGPIHILFWGSRVVDVVEVSCAKDVFRVTPKDGGGTSPECVFEYLSRRDVLKQFKKLGVQGTKNMLVVVMTDGYFWGSESVLRGYGSAFPKTGWLLTDKKKYRTFDAPFGAVAKLVYDEEREVD